jgi:hypothetical protein
MKRRRGEVIPPPHSPLLEALPSVNNIFYRQVGIAVDARRSNRTWTETGPSTDSSLQPHLALVPP